jgi:hypothetical protein
LGKSTCSVPRAFYALRCLRPIPHGQLGSKSLVCFGHPGCQHRLVRIRVHVIALFALIGMGLDLLGGLFLAYDLFGRRRGPLRTLLRAILYCFIFVAVFSIALDWRFSLVAGIGLGLTFTYELGRRASAVEGVAAPQEPREFFSLKRQQISLALLRGSFLAAGAAWAFSSETARGSTLWCCCVGGYRDCSGAHFSWRCGASF